MGIFNLFKKVSTDGSHATNTVKPFAGDKAKYQWDSSAKEYCRQFNKSIEELELVDYNIIDEYSGNHIAFFLTWIIQNGFYDLVDTPKEIAEAIEAVNSERMTGIDFLMHYCDGVLSREDLDPGIYEFVDMYYEPDYLNDYTRFVENGLHKKALGIRFSWEEYDRFKHIIDNAYAKYKKHNVH